MSQLPHMKPDAGGVIRAGVLAPGTVRLAVEPACGCESAAVPLDLDPTEARLLGRWLIRLANQARTTQPGGTK